jgi:threonine/homoserine/homoserine lactone efflux protein
VFEHLGVFYRGLLLGLMVAAPVGPIGLMCIRRTLLKGLLVGFTTGLGAACADTIFSIIAVLGVAAVLEFIRKYQEYIHFFGGLFLLAVAFHTWRDVPKAPPNPAGFAHKFINYTKQKVSDTEASWLACLQSFMTGLAITLTNPLTLFAVLAVVATFGGLKKHADAGLLVSGIFAGSTLWWIILSGGIASVRGHFTENRILLVNRITAVILAAIAGWAICNGIREFLKDMPF